MELHKTNWEDNRHEWRREPPPHGCNVVLHWSAQVTIEIDEDRLKALVRTAAASKGKEAQRGPFRLRLKNFTEKEVTT